MISNLIIKNTKKLQTNKKKRLVLSILESGLKGGMPDAVLKKIIYKNKIALKEKTYYLCDYDKIFVVSVGKAAFSMTRSICKRTRIDGGIVVIPKNVKYHGMPGFKILQSGHPIPDKKSVLTARSIISFLSSRSPQDLVIFLFSGGASSLVALPDGVSLGQKQATTRILLKCGAAIDEINCVRKHLSKIKGGRLAEYVKCHGLSLIMSDVIGNDLYSVVSGITYGDNTTFYDAKKILEKYHIQKLVPPQVMKHIQKNISKKQITRVKKIKNHIICDNSICLDFMKRQAKKLGLSVTVVPNISGNVIDVSKRLVVKTRSTQCLIFGGETTVTVKGNGSGGRNQELILRLADLFEKKGIKCTIGCMGTDGIDGNTDAAGAIIQTDAKHNEIYQYLEKNDSYHFFKKYGGLVYTGPTQTNLVDIGVILN